MVREAQASGARRQVSCALLEVSLRTVERWEKAPDKGDQRRGRDTGRGDLSPPDRPSLLSAP